MLDIEDGKRLIRLARDAVSCVFKRRRLVVDESTKKRYKEEQGAFVTLKIEGRLRGCIGFPEPVFPLWRAVADAAKSAAFSDPRFPPLTEDEYERVSVELSVLTQPELIRAMVPEDYLKKIKVGRDGLIIKAGVYSGLLLPQVPVEYRWDAETFLRQLCMKAGLSMDAWQNVSHRIYKFQAQVFKEENGEVVEERL